MKARASLLLAALLLASFPAMFAISQSGLPSVELGYGPGSLFPLAQGTPVYTGGDQLWVGSAYGGALSAELFAPGATVPVSTVPISSSSVQEVYTFSGSDESGQWSLVLVSQKLPIEVIPVEVEQPPALSSPRLSSASLLTNGSLLANFTMSLGESYNGQGCLLGSSVPSQVSFAFPAADGQGSVILTTNGMALNAYSVPSGTPGARSSSMDFWVELYYPYSFAVGGSSEQLVTRNLLVARTDPTVLNSTSRSNSTLNLTTFANLRAGRYEMVAYFRDSTGLTAQEASVLWSGTGPWVWLGGCEGLEPLAGVFSFEVTLATPTVDWPSHVLVMADVAGVEGSAFSPVRFNTSAVRLTAGNWGPQIPSGLSVSVMENPSIEASAVVNGTVYLELSRTSANVSILVSSGGSQPEALPAVVARAQAEVTLPVTLGKVTIMGESNGEPVAGAAVSISGVSAGNRSRIMGVANAEGAASFLLVPGNYSLLFQYKGFDSVGSVLATGGQIATVKVEVPQNINYLPDYILAGIGVAGLLLNVFVWRRALWAHS